MRVRGRPLDPIFNPEKSQGGITVGNTPSGSSGIIASGGIETVPGDGYKYHTFRTPGLPAGQLVVTVGGVCEVLAIGAGGAGGSIYGGGGAAGELVIASFTLTDLTTYNCQVGTGGSSGGEASTLELAVGGLDLIAAAGGPAGGPGGQANQAAMNGGSSSAGASGAGGGGSTTVPAGLGGSSTGGGPSSHHNPGGDGYDVTGAGVVTDRAGGGGGGAAEAGDDATPGVGGDGGDGSGGR